MKLMKHLFSSLFIAGAMLSTQAIAEENTAEQAQPQPQPQPQPQTQVQQQTAVQAPSQTVQQSVSDRLNINTASASDIQKALIGIGAKKQKPLCSIVKNTVISLWQNNYLKYKALAKPH